ncbi:MAG: hypothetical protein MI824_08195, partial [Hyphomicrobiales bacterium]|nr:hypothetical protein [Hyphomicrobiales bacterium]
MKTIPILRAMILTAGILISGDLAGAAKDHKNVQAAKTDWQGKWVRMAPSGVIGLEIKADGLVTVNFGNDQTVEVVAQYEIHHDTITFHDQEGKMCQGAGTYTLYKHDHYLAFDLIDDMCNGRIKSIMGFWTRPDFNNSLKVLDAQIADAQKPPLYLHGARIYMATGQPRRARSDLDVYLQHDTLNARAFIHRAGTRFPDDLEGVVTDCNKAMTLAPGNKNVYF